MSDKDERDSLSGEDDLFGDGDGENGDGGSISDPEQLLSDLDEDAEESDGGKRSQRAGGAEDGPPSTIKVQTVQMFRHQTPKPTDGTVHASCSVFSGIDTVADICSSNPSESRTSSLGTPRSTNLRRTSPHRAS